MSWDFCKMKIDFQMILILLGVHSNCFVQQQKKHAYQELSSGIIQIWFRPKYVFSVCRIGAFDLWCCCHDAREWVEGRTRSLPCHQLLPHELSLSSQSERPRPVGSSRRRMLRSRPHSSMFPRPVPATSVSVHGESRPGLCNRWFLGHWIKLPRSTNYY